MNIKGISNKWFLILLGIVLSSPAIVGAQTTDDVLRYSLEYPSYDPVSIVIPGVSSYTGFGAYQDNPAVMALAPEGYLSFSLSSRFAEASGSYLGNTTEHSDSQTGVGDLGFVYKFPTTRGSLVFGGGYSQTTDYNRTLGANGFNEESTITDYYNSTLVSDDIYFTAYDAFAIYDPSPGDGDYSNTTSAFRANGYQGIQQNLEMTERGQLGEYSAFLATEAAKNLFIGASVGISGGTYTYERDFLESDRNNDYNNRSNNTDIDQILSYDTIDAKMQSFSARLGLMYRPAEAWNIGVSYEFPSRLEIEEEYNTVITTTFDNGDVEEHDAPGDFSYDIIRPPRLKAGVTYTGNEKITLTAAAESVFYTEAEYDEEGLSDYETQLNNEIQSVFKDIVNFRGGIEYKMNDQFIPRVGYGYYADPTRGFDSSRQFISGGFSTKIGPNTSLDIGLQYGMWEDQNVIYSYESGNNVIDEVVHEDVGRLNVMAGIKMAL
jgi:hypothetical protein